MRCPTLRPAAIASFAALLLAPALRADSERLPRAAATVVDYDLHVALDPETKALDGGGRLVWTNPSDDPIDELWFHLYLNAFRDNRSTFYRESGGHLRDDEAPEDGWGWTDLTALRLEDGTDLLPGLAFEHPDDDNADDRTVARVPLPAPIPPRGSVTLDFSFRARLPKVYARAGYFENFFAVTQWFPKIAVYEPAGLRGRAAGGWNAHQYHANSEFYADYGRFRVAMTVPDGWVVGATGPRIETRANGDGTTTFVHEQRDVHDFAWTADPRFVEIVEPFVAASEVSAAELAAAAELVDRPVAEVALSDVEIHLLLQPSHRPQAARYLASAKLALKWFGLWYGRYPYPTLTIVDPPADAGGASGVEYPTLFFGGTSYERNFWPANGFRDAEIVTVHEFGHQFWYGLVGSNEFEEAWLDEGFNTYSTAKVMDLGYGARTSVVSRFGLELGLGEVDRLGNHSERRFDRIATNAWGFSPHQYSFNAYSRPALVLETLEGMLGEETMARAMRTYSERFRFGHPRGEDFETVAAEVSGRDLRSFFDQVIRGSGVYDPAIVRIASSRAPAYRGRDDSRPGGIVDEEEALAEESDDPKAPYRSFVDFEQRGEVRLPVEVELRFEGAEPERRVWNGDRAWERWTFERPERLLSATLDPDHLAPLDANRLNNSMRTTDDRSAARAWTVKTMFAIERALAWLGL